MKLLISIIFISTIILSSYQYNTEKNNAVQADSTYTFLPLQVNPNCFYTGGFKQRLKVYDLDEYSSTQKLSECPVDSFPAIDFTVHSLVGIDYKFSGCSTTIKRVMECTYHPVHKKAVIRLVLFEKGVCKPSHYGIDWFVIPKIPDGYSIEFTTTVEKVMEITPNESK
ncbi:MAG: hypothetical protein H7259_03020 [Cytophagales bacterium]|nr:hypothetical protein [Cytophaga sp.]